MGILLELDNNALQRIEDDACNKRRGATYCLLMFHARWCNNCHKVKSMLEEAASKLKSNHPKLTAAMLDVDNYAEEADYYAVSNLPTVVLLSAGQAKRYNGSHSVDSFVRFVNNNVRPANR